MVTSALKDAMKLWRKDNGESLARIRKEYDTFASMHVNPPTFWEWLEQRKIK